MALVQTEHNRIKKPNWREEGPVGYLYTSVTKDLSRDNREQIQQVPRAGLEPGTRRIASPMQWPLGYTTSHKNLINSRFKKC